MLKLGFCAPVPNQIRDRVLSEVEKNSFIALPGQSRFLPLKLCVPTQDSLVRSFIAMV